MGEQKIKSLGMVGNCTECPYRLKDSEKRGLCAHPSAEEATYDITLEGSSFPDWCPLIDMKDFYEGLKKSDGELEHLRIVPEGYRGLSKAFLAAMKERLDHGRKKGYVGWDQYWEDCIFPIDPMGENGFLMQRLREEVEELAKAVRRVISTEKGSAKDVLLEAADVANFAMMVADIEGALERGWFENIVSPWE